jgi:cation:H+ antiporter
MKFFLTAALLLAETELPAASPLTVLWAGPGILVASLMIAWGAEATQFFLAQGIALAVLALLQTLPEFAMEAVFAWHRQVPFLFASLTGALMLLTGLGWPLIYFSAARAYRREFKRRPLLRVRLESEHSIQVLALFVAIAYEAIVWWKGVLTIYDGVALIAIYAGYVWITGRLPPEKPERIDEIAVVPRSIILARKPVRIAAILLLFIVGGVVVFLVANPFLEGLFGLSLLIGIPKFQFVQWIAPLVSEAPEGISAFYWARDPYRAPIALMNLVSSNINQWTLLAGLLPIVLSLSAGRVTGIPLDAQQSRDLLLTLSQSLLGALFLLKLELAWWEATGLFVLFVVQLAASELHAAVTWFDFGWCAVELLLFLTGNRKVAALRRFREVMK